MSKVDIFNFFPKPTKAQTENIMAYQLYMDRYSQVAIDNFEWTVEGKPISEIGLESRRFEKPLFMTGYACFFYNDILGYCVLPAAVRGDLDIYGEPTQWTGVGTGASFPVNETNSVLIRNNLFGLPSSNIAMYYAQKVSDVQRTIDTQVFLHKMPFLVKASDKTILSKKNILEQKKDNELAVFINSKVSGDDFEVFPTPTPYIIDKLYAYKQELEAEYYGLFGYQNNPQEKKERLIVDEVNANNELTDNGYAGGMWQMRKNACEKIKRIYGLDIDVNIKRRMSKSDEFYATEDEVKVNVDDPGGDE